jgi:ADP-heptose:LPS heptosyltransferase
MPERYGQLANLIYSKYNLKTVIGWGPGEEQLVEQMLTTGEKHSIPLPLTTMKQLSAVIEKAKLFVGGDTGPMHISSFVKTPLVAILGPSDPILNKPASFTPYKIVYAEVDCSPCRNKKCSHLKCLTTISTQEVFDNCKQFLNTNK